MKKEIKFEEALEKLAEINEKLESEEISLDDSIKLFKEGIELSKLCQKKLDEAKLEIEKNKSDNAIIIKRSFFLFIFHPPFF